MATIITNTRFGRWQGRIGLGEGWHSITSVLMNLWLWNFTGFEATNCNNLQYIISQYVVVQIFALIWLIGEVKCEWEMTAAMVSALFLCVVIASRDFVFWCVHWCVWRLPILCVTSNYSGELGIRRRVLRHVLSRAKRFLRFQERPWHATCTERFSRQSWGSSASAHFIIKIKPQFYFQNSVISIKLARWLLQSTFAWNPIAFIELVG